MEFMTTICLSMTIFWSESGGARHNSNVPIYHLKKAKPAGDTRDGP